MLLGMNNLSKEKRVVGTLKSERLLICLLVRHSVARRVFIALYQTIPVE